MNTLSINYFTNSGGGNFTVNLDALLPCSNRDFEILLNTVSKSNDCSDHIKTLDSYISSKINYFKDMRAGLDSENDAAYISKLTSTIKKYVALNNLLVKRFGVDPVTDKEASIKLKSASFYGLFKGFTVTPLQGWIFEKGGYTFEVFKNQSGGYTVMLSGTGVLLKEVDRKNECVAAITPKLLKMLDNNPDKIQAARDTFKKYMIAAGYMKAEANDTENNTHNKQEAEAMKNTTTNYFAGIKTLEELRTSYRDLLKANHPDNGGSVEITQEINKQYKEAFDLLKSGANLEDKREAMKWNEAEDEAIREALYKVIHLDGLNIEVVGCWIWVDGNTMENKDALKAAGYTWSRNRKKWHFAPYENKFYKGNKKTFDQIRRMYGSVEVENEKQETIAG